MARITDLSFEAGGAIYTFHLDFDDAAIVQSAVAFDISVERRAGKSPPLSIAARVEILPAQDQIVVYVAGQEVFRTDMFGRGASPLEQLIAAIPAPLLGDPITGCCIKAGLSAVIGQAIDCANSLEGNLRWRVFSEFLHCMTRHFGRISRIAMFRAFKCMLLPGEG